MPRVVDYPLNNVDEGVEWVISRVNSHDEDRLKYLDSLSLKPGTPFTLVERAPFNGPLQLRVKGEIKVIGHELAGVLRVCKPEQFELA